MLAALLLLLFLLPFASAQTTAGSAPALSWLPLMRGMSPGGRGAPAMAYDPVSKKVVLFGGFDSNGYLNDTWTFDGGVWTEQTSSLAPPPRAAAAMAFDRGSQRLVLFGGFNGHYLNDTWTWDGSTSTWEQMAPSASPGPATGAMMFTDPLDGHADIYGGFGGHFYSGATWQWTGGTWQLLNTPVFPFSRGSAPTALDLANHTVVLFGGLADIFPINTWTFDGTNWTHQFPATQPTWRFYSGAAYEPHLQAVVVFGGAYGGTDLNDTWEWTGTNWVQLYPQPSPTPRESFGMAYDEALGSVVIFGGKHGHTLYGDTWTLVVR
jgi:hypothetical protein